MKKDGEIENLKEGWEKLTDMLRASYTCDGAQHGHLKYESVLDVIERLQSNAKATILRIKPRLGPANKNQNDIIVNFDY